MFDCGSDPTNYHFDSENDCTYRYYPLISKVVFLCKHSVSHHPIVMIDIIKWNEDIIIFNYEGSRVTLSSDDEE